MEMNRFLVDLAAFKAVAGRAERLGCVRFTRISASFTAPFLRTALFVGWPKKRPPYTKKTRKGMSLPRFALRVLQLLEKLEFRFRHLAIQRREASGIDARPCEHARCGIVFRIEAHRHAATRRYRARGRNHGRMRMRGSKSGLRCHSRMRRLKRHNVDM